MHKHLEKKSIRIHMSSRSRVRPSLIARIPRLQRSDTNLEPERDELTRAAQSQKYLRDDHHPQPERFHPALTKKPLRRLCSLEPPRPDPSTFPPTNLCRLPVFRTSSRSACSPPPHPAVCLALRLHFSLTRIQSSAFHLQPPSAIAPLPRSLARIFLDLR